MSEQEKQEGQKTVVSFIAGLLIGGLLVWVFGGAPKEEVMEEVMEQETSEVEEVNEEVALEEATEEETTQQIPELEVGIGAVTVADQAAGMSVTLEGATFPTEEGWVVVRTYPNEQLGSILGAARYSKEQGLIPSEVILLAPTTAGRDYAIVFFSEDGDRVFDLATDAQMGAIAGTFTAQ